MANSKIFYFLRIRLAIAPKKTHKIFASPFLYIKLRYIISTRSATEVVEIDKSSKSTIKD